MLAEWDMPTEGHKRGKKGNGGAGGGAGPGKLRTVRAGGPRHFVGRTWGGGRVVGGAVVGRRDMNLLP